MSVLADGCFDPIHWGHLRYLASAARLGSPLIVRVAPDDEIRAKGRTPFQTQAERRSCLLRVLDVDDVAMHDTLAAAIEDHRPNVLAKGVDWVGRVPADVIAACRRHGTVLVFVATQERSATERLA